MTEEEKKAIKWLKELYDIEKDFNSSAGKEESNIIKTIINLIEKQQKEIEEYKSGDFFTAKQMHRIDEDYIDKVKIIGKIEELEQLNEMDIEQSLFIANEYIINTLKELLEG